MGNSDGLALFAPMLQVTKHSSDPKSRCGTSISQKEFKLPFLRKKKTPLKQQGCTWYFNVGHNWAPTIYTDRSFWFAGI